MILLMCMGRGNAHRHLTNRVRERKTDEISDF